MEASMHEIPLARPEIRQEDIDAVVEVLKSGSLSCGPWVERFESDLARAVGTPYAVAVANGTCALHLVVRALGLNPGDEVVTTPYSFVASSNAALFEGATPVFADIDPKTYALCPDAVESKITAKTKAILAVDVFGRLAPWERLAQIAKRRGLFLIEDSCEALGTPRAGSFGEAGVFGFYPNKQLTSGEGGAITTHDANLAALAKSMRNQGRSMDHRFLVHDRLGFNFRLPDISCALLSSQLRRLPEIVRSRAKVAAWYNERLRDLPLRLPMMDAPEGTSWFVYIVELPEKIPERAKDGVIEALRTRGIGAGAYFPPIHLQPFYRNTFGYKEGMFPVAEYVGLRTIALPFSTLMTEAQVDRVGSELRAILESMRL